MTLPDGISTCTVTFGKALGPLGTEASISGAITMDRKIVHAASGYSINPADEAVTPAPAGGQLSFVVPHVDQDGFIDSSGEEVKNWYYVLTGRAVFPSKTITFQKTFQVFVGQTNVDLDVIPDGPAIPGVSTPFPEVISVAGANGAVSAGYLQEQLGVEPIDGPTLADDVASKIPLAQKGAADGVAPLDAEELVPEVNLPLATAAVKGLVELATTLESQTGTDTQRAVTPAGLKAALDDAISGVLNGAPGALDTLKELADALGDDANFAATVTTALAGKVPLAEKGAADGVAPLDSGTKVPRVHLPAATDTGVGGVELATDAEALEGTDTARAVTPAGVKAAVDPIRDITDETFGNNLRASIDARLSSYVTDNGDGTLSFAGVGVTDNGDGTITFG